MNKYFLPIISILILFQSFKVFDEISYHDDSNAKKGFEIISKEIETSEGKMKINEKIISLSEAIDFDSLFKPADIVKGKKLSKQCQACHDFSTNLKIKTGPPLWGLINREVAIIKDYKYSDALSELNKNWTRSELFFFLENPKEYVKGTKMVYKGLKKESDRVNLISFLESLK
ncbi:MAG: c-type cytochrome [Alphaproteobacteria bacterium]